MPSKNTSKTDRERLAVIETDIKYIKNTRIEDSLKLNAIECKLDTFIDKADNKYATKEELNKVVVQVAENTKSIFAMVREWGPVIMIGGFLLFNYLKGVI